MNKEAYMSSLQAALQGFDEDLVQEIVADYEERFRIGAEQGKTEEQVIAELGSVEGLVMELGEMQSFAQETQQKQTKNGAERTTQNAADHNAGTTGNTNNTGNQTYRGTYTQDKSFSESLDGFMKTIGKVVDEAMREAGMALETAMEKVEIHVEEVKRRRAAGENVDYDININVGESEKESGKEPNVEQSGKGDENCRKVVIDANIADVEIRRTSGSIPTAECKYYSHKTAMAYPFYAYQEGDTFHVGIRDEYQEKKSGYFQFSWNPSIEIMLGIPETVQTVTANVTSGDLTADELSAEVVKVRSGSGDIKVSYFNGKECRLESSSGDVTLEKSKVQDAEITSKSGDAAISKLETTRLNVNTASGDMEVNGIVAEEIKLSSMSGDQSLDDVEAKKLHTNTASGDMDITDCRGTVLQVSAASGDISISGDFAEYHVHSASGDVELTSRHDANIIVKSTSGDVEVLVMEASAVYEVTTHTVSGECNVGGHRGASEAAEGETIYHIEGKSISGDVSVQFR